MDSECEKLVKLKLKFRIFGYTKFDLVNSDLLTECAIPSHMKWKHLNQTFGLDLLLPPSCIQPMTEECLAWVKDSFQPQVLVASRNGLTSQCNKKLPQIYSEWCP